MEEAVNPVRKWLTDLRLMTEGECMCVLQGKSLQSDNSDSHSALLKRDGINKIQELANIISAELTTLFRYLERENWKNLRHKSIQVTYHIRKLINFSNTIIPNPPQYIIEQEDVVMGECAQLAQQADSRISNGDGARLKVQLVNQLTYLGQSLSRMVDLLLGHLVQCIVQYLEETEVPEDLNSAISTLINLGLEGEHMCYIIAREGGLRVLFDVCRSPSADTSKSQALRAVATICCESESIEELERVGGIECLVDILCKGKANEDLQGEAAGVIAQITSPSLDHYHQFTGFLENMPDLVHALIELCETSTKPEVLLLSAAALANVTFMESMVSQLLLQAEAPRVLMRIAEQNKSSSMFAKDQLVTILANMATVDVCRDDIVRHNGIKLLMTFLHERPHSYCSEAEISACERVQQKAAIALTRLSREAENAQIIMQQEGLSRLVELCRDATERHNSDAVLVACLAALRKICSLCGIGDMSLIDVQQLVQPRLMDSFLICTHRDENFV